MHPRLLRTSLRLISHEMKVARPSSAIIRPFSSSTTTSTLVGIKPSTELNFDDVSTSFAKKTDTDLIRALLVFRLCNIRSFVNNADRLLSLSNNILASRLTKMLLKATFFGHFCAGENAKETAEICAELERRGLGSIWDFAAEADVTSAKGGLDRAHIGNGKSHDEAGWIKNTELFNESLVNAGKRPNGFAAIKLTAMTSPDVLEVVSLHLLAIKRFYDGLIHDRHLDIRDFPPVLPSARLTLQQWKDGVRLHEKENQYTDEQLENWFRSMKSQSNSNLSDPNTVDWLEFSAFFDTFSRSGKVVDRPKLSCIPTLSESDRNAFDSLITRTISLGKTAEANKVRLLIDAEQTYFQPAIDYCVLQAQQVNNKSFPYVFNTFQCYLKDTYSRYLVDLERATREGWKLGVKCVRGAYMRQERKRAQDCDYIDPVQPNFEATTADYHRLVEHVFHNLDKAHVVVAGHNENTVKYLTQKMTELNVPRDEGKVFFGQLLGMCDHVSYELSAHHYNVIKVCPYGPVNEVVPYLIRRAQENADVLPRTTKERQLVVSELRRRLFGSKKPATSVPTSQTPTTPLPFK